jgi:hypothetical protein
MPVVRRAARPGGISFSLVENIAVHTSFVARNLREPRPVTGVIFLQAGIRTMEAGARAAKILRCMRRLGICYKSGGLIITNATIQHHTDP